MKSWLELQADWKRNAPPSDPNYRPDLNSWRWPKHAKKGSTGNLSGSASVISSKAKSR